MTVSCAVCSSSEELLVIGEWAGTHRSSCSHAACRACLQDWIAKELPRCSENGQLRMPCLAEGCRKALPQALVFHASGAAMDVAGQIDRANQVKVKELPDMGAAWWNHTLEQARLSNLAARAGCTVLQARGTKGPLICSFCSEESPALISNWPCGHRACAGCWTRRVEAQLPPPDACKLANVTCVEGSCCEQISWGLLSCVCARHSQAVQFYAAHQDKQFKKEERHWLLRTKPDNVEVKTFKICPVCKEPRARLLSSSPCDHSACEECWLSWTEAGLEKCWTLRQFRPGCINCDTKDTSCRCERGISEALWTHLCGLSPAVSEFDKKMEREVTRHRLLLDAGVTLDRALDAPNRGARCGICCEPAFALLQNTPCSHGACADCWPRWAATQVPRCQGEKQPVAKCFTPGCTEEVVSGLWQHCCRENEEVQTFNRLVERRRKLQANDLYPAPMQVDCPRSGCWGLGYLGQDTVMCFICEHMWSAEDPGTTAEADINEELGVGGKRCPSCNEFIEKNGGCDHMTCRCGYEFYWTTLKPYTS